VPGQLGSPMGGGGGGGHWCSLRESLQEKRTVKL
jgi:hypothetical protein